MRKILWLFVLLACIQFKAATQSSRAIDSLSSLLLREKSDTGQSILLARLAYALSTSRPDTAIAVAQQALVLGESTGNMAVESYCLNTLGNVFATKGNYPKALEMYLMALKKSEYIKEDRICVIYGNIGNVYSYTGDHRKSLDYLFRAKDLAEKLHNEYWLTATYLNIGDSYEKLNLLDSARQFATLANDLSTKIQRKETLALSVTNFGNIYRKRNEPEIALAYYRAGLGALTEVDDQAGLAETSIGMARIFQQLNNTDSSLHYARVSLAIAQAGGFSPQVLDAATFLGAYYRKLKVVDSAYAYLLTAIDTKDSLFNQEKAREMESLGFDESIRQQRLASEKLQTAQARHQNIQYAGMAIGVLCFAIVFLLLSRSVVVNAKWIRFLGILGLLLVFEFVNLFLHPLLGDLTHHSPLLMLGILVLIAALLIPLHHRLEHWIVTRMTSKNKQIRLAAARKTVTKLEAEVGEK